MFREGEMHLYLAIPCHVTHDTYNIVVRDYINILIVGSTFLHLKYVTNCLSQKKIQGSRHKWGCYELQATQCRQSSTFSH